MAAAAPAASKLLNIRKTSVLQNLIRSNILRATAAPISLVLKSSTDSHFPVQFDGEVPIPSVKLNAPTAAEMRKMINPGIGFWLGMAGLPGVDQSEWILKSNRSPSKVEDEDDDEEEIEDDLDKDDSADDYDPDAIEFEYSDGPSGSDSDD